MLEKKPTSVPEMCWSVYMLRCRGGALYTGIASDVSRRVREHNQGRGARYTKSRGPVELIYVEVVGNRSSALKRELQIKRLRREEKLELVAEPSCRLKL